MIEFQTALSFCYILGCQEYVPISYPLETIIDLRRAGLSEEARLSKRPVKARRRAGPVQNTVIRYNRTESSYQYCSHLQGYRDDTPGRRDHEVCS